jgi:threonine/homoserine/homoserine lactone efflux protein
MVSIMFLAGVSLLLVTPGPTNALLATAGAAAGWRPAPKLLAAELVAYQITIVAAGLALQPLFGQAPEARLAIQGAAALYLLCLARRLWRHGQDAGAAAVIGPRQVATTTLLNPKGLIIALGLMPEAAWGEPAALLAHLAVLALMTPLFGGLWLATGVIGGKAAGAQATQLLPRAAAVALCLFAGLLARSALAG